MADGRCGRRDGWRGLVLATAAATGLAVAAAGQDEPDGEPPPLDQDLEALLEDIVEMDIEQLMEVAVTSVTGRAQPLIDTPAAIFVITPEDIRRTGHRSIAEALRMVPGIQVGQISPSIWAVGSRGFPERFSTDLLVLIDGRTVYDPLYSGVFWHVQDTLLEDLDRIEVIRGPGATLWGANAVNGVINITTKSARDTQGLFVQGGGGNVHEGFGAIRYGGKINDDAHFRVWGKYDNHDSFDDLTGADTSTDWDMFRGGFRFDFDGEDDTHLTVQGDVYGTNEIGENVRVAIPGAHLQFANVPLDEEYNGGNVLLRAERRASDVEGW
ncbi:MAG: TonB-dependent receptor plug domain-containing protein, partial [Planctomycetota bacterium]